MKYFTIILIALCLVYTDAFPKENPRTSIREYQKYTIKEINNSYSLVMEAKVAKTYYTVPLPNECYFRVFQPTRCEIDDIKAKLNGETIEKITKFNESNEDIFLNDNYIHLIDYSKHNVSKLMKLEVSYVKECNNAQFIQPYFIYNADSLEMISIEYNHPDNITIDCSPWFSHNNIPLSIERTRNRTIFTIKELPRFGYLPFFPYNSLHGVLLFSLKKNTVDVFSNSRVAFTKWYMEQINELPGLLNEDVGELKERVLQQPNDEEKIKIIYDWVRANVRYIAEEQDYGAFIPRSASKVMRRKFGDCKDKALLVREIAKLFGIKVHLALINTNPTFYIEDKVYLNQFNHMICYTVVNNKEIFFDPTATAVEFGYLPDSDIDKSVFILDEDNPRYLYAKENTTNSSNFIVDLTTKLEGELESVGTITLKNKEQGIFQYYLEIGNVDKGLEYVRNKLSAYFPKIKWTNLILKEITKSEAVFTVNGGLKNLLVKTAKKIYIPHIPFSVVDEDIFIRRNDSLPVYFSDFVNIAFKLTIQTNQYTLNPLSKREFGNKTDAYISTELHISLDNSIVVNTMLDWNYSFVAKDQKGTFNSFIDELFSSQKNYFIINSK